MNADKVFFWSLSLSVSTEFTASAENHQPSLSKPSLPAPT